MCFSRRHHCRPLKKGYSRRGICYFPGSGDQAEAGWPFVGHRNVRCRRDDATSVTRLRGTLPTAEQTQFTNKQDDADARSSTLSAALKRFYAMVRLDASRVGPPRFIERASGSCLEIQAEIPNGVPENVMRTVTENCRTLKFGSQGFEKD